jgi:hypothetical protein
MNDFCDLLGTPYAPVSKIEPVYDQAKLACAIYNIFALRCFF